MMVDDVDDDHCSFPPPPTCKNMCTFMAKNDSARERIGKISFLFDLKSIFFWGKKNGIFIRAKWHFKCTCICWHISLFWKLHSRQILGNNTKAIVHRLMGGWSEGEHVCTVTSKMVTIPKKVHFHSVSSSEEMLYDRHERVSVRKIIVLLQQYAHQLFPHNGDQQPIFLFLAFELHSGFS